MCLRALFEDTDKLRPERTDAQVTQEAAMQFARLAERLELEERSLGATREQIADSSCNCSSASSPTPIGLLPNKAFRSLLRGQDRFLPT